MTADRPIKVLHGVGHLHRGGIEAWLHQMVRRLPPERFEHHVLVWTADEQHYTRQFQEAGAMVIPLVGHARPTALIRGLRRVVRERGPYDVLHTHGTHFYGPVMLLASRLGIRVRVAHSHTDIRPVLAEAGRGYRLYAAAGHALIRRLATRGLAVSRLAAESMFGPDWRSDPRWGLHYCGIDLGAFERPPDPTLRRALGLPEDRPVIGHVGRFEPQKNHTFLLSIAAELAKAGRPTHFLLVGDGGLRAGFEAELRRRGLERQFTLVPDSTEVPRLMTSAMDGFVFPSLYEGLPLAPVEAQAAGLPMVVSDGVSEEVVIDPARARVVPLGAGAAAWAHALAALPPRVPSEDRTLRRELAHGPFNVANSASRLGEIYLDACAAARSRADRPVRRRG